MKEQREETGTAIRLLFRLLPVQILLAMVGTVNGIISTYFASNMVGVDAMTAVGIYSPLNILNGAIGTLLSGGSAILCGKYMGRNEQEKVRGLFSLNLLLAGGIGLLLAALFLAMAAFDLTGFLSRDEAVRPLFDTYLIGQAAGVFPFLVGSQLPVYLSMENRQNLSLTASLVYIGVNLLLQYLLVAVLRMGALGLALASSVGLWVFLGIQLTWFLGGKARIRLQIRHVSWRESGEILKTGLPGAAASGYQTLRGIIVNNLLEAFVGSVGISAFTAANNLLGIFWAVPAGMAAVSRLMISVSVGEEDRQTLTDVTRNMFRRFVPIMCAVAALVMALAEPFTRLFFRDPTAPVYMMTVWGFRLLPLCMPLAVICTHFTCYCQSISRQTLVHVLAVLDGFACVAAFSALLVPRLGLNGVYIANILNGVVCVLVIAGYAWMKNKRPPRNAEELLVLPKDFGAGPEDRIDICVRNMEEVLAVSRQVGEFCSRRGIDARRAYIASLCLEEMAGNIVAHGFTKDRKSHRIDIRAVFKGNDLILRIRDDCVPFDPEERSKLTDPEDKIKNLGIRMVYQAAREVEYQSVLGLNVLTMRI